MKGGKMNVESSKAESKLAVKNTKPMKAKKDLNTKPMKEKKDPNTKPMKEKKDPNTKPKNPVASYFVFMEEFREQYLKDHPDKSIKDAHYDAGVAWHAMPEQEKAPYVAEFKKRKIAYDKAMKAYNKKPHGGREDFDVSDPAAWDEVYD